MAKSAKRRRELARQRWQRQEARRSQTSARRVRVMAIAGVVVLLAVVAGGGVLLSGALDDDETVAASNDSDVQEDGQQAASCDYRDTGTPAVPDLGLPGELPAAGTEAATAELTLNGDVVTVELNADVAPCTVHSFAFLAAADYFDGTTCHRLTTSDTLKVLQCGDPTGTGSGGPGYQFDNENPDNTTYAAGTVAMANSGVDTNGSQFFLVYEDSQLPPDYTVFGQVTGGLDVIAAIATTGTDNGLDDGVPVEPVTLNDVTTAAANLDEDSP